MIIEYRIVHYTDNGKDIIGFNLNNIKHVLAICHEIIEIKEDPFEPNHITSQDRIVLKVLHKTKNGIYYNVKLGSGYGSPQKRIYLNKRQLKVLEDYKETLESYIGEKIVWGL